MGPTCNVSLNGPLDDTVLDAIDAYLGTVSEKIVRTRKGRNWEIWVHGRPIGVSVVYETESSLASIDFWAGCNSPEDYSLLRKVSGDLAVILNARASEPSK